MASKYNNERVEADGYIFDSKAERDRYLELKLMAMEGAISSLELQPSYVLQPRFTRNGKTIRAITYIADFTYIDEETGRRVVEDVKGMKTKEFQIKAKMFAYRYPDLRLDLITAKRRGKGRS